MSDLKAVIEAAFERRTEITPRNVETTVKDAVRETIEQLDRGVLRVAEKVAGAMGRARVAEEGGPALVPHRGEPVHQGGLHQLLRQGALEVRRQQQPGFPFRRRPGGATATARKGAYIAPNVVLMPSYVNIGAYVDEGTMVDTWATVGSCAQIGKNVHLSGGVGIGGVLEPLQAAPTIIEDNCFIGARSEIVEGVIVEEGAVISMGVYIGQSTRIYDREKDEITYGRVPAGAVVVSGNLPSKDGRYSLYCAVIVKRVDAEDQGQGGFQPAAAGCAGLTETSDTVCPARALRRRGDRAGWADPRLDCWIEKPC
jgi:2,3,4,5-tetrahydropyridine-2,6-dicarboxylate N-succinyltransferase